MRITTTTEIVDDGTPDARTVRRDVATINGEHIELLRPAGGEAEVVFAGQGYTLAGARRLSRALGQLVSLAER